MSEPGSTSDSLAAEERCHRLCREFEAELKEGQTPYIEAYLHKVPEAEHGELFRELLALELGYACETPRLDDYVLRFPKHEEVTKAVFAEVRSSADSRQDDSPQGGLPSTVSEAGLALARKARSVLPLPNIPGYELLEELGRGGMAVVYRARHLKLDRIVALKMIRGGEFAGDEEKREFEAEAQAVARFQHPNIVPIYEIGEHVDQPYFTQELLEGGSLAARLKGEPQPPRQAAEMTETLARAMHYAHERRIIHRDLKPANVLLAADGTPKVADFGLAKSLPEDAGQAETQRICGTPSYMAPEQEAHDVRLIGPATDVYALGAILYEMLTGRPPFKGATNLDTLEQVRTQEPVPPTRLQPKVPRDLETICLKCLEKDRRKRYLSAEAMAADLRRFLNNEPIKARPITRWERAVKWGRREPKVAALIGLVVLACVLGVAGVFVQLQETRAALTDLQKSQTEKDQETTQKIAAIEEAARREAGERAAKAKAAEEQQKARIDAYFRNVAAAHRAWLANNITQADRLLDDCAPELRQWEWRYHQRLCHSDLLTVTDGPLTFSRDGRWLAHPLGTAVQLRDDSGRLLHELRGHGGPVDNLSFSGDGKLLVTVSWNGRRFTPARKEPYAGEVLVWEVSSGTRLSTLILKGHERGVRSLAFSPDGQRLASGDDGKTIKLWEIPSGKELRTLKGHEGPVVGLRFSDDALRLTSVGIKTKGEPTDNVPGEKAPADVQIKVWDTNNGGCTCTFDSSPNPQIFEPSQVAAVSPDGKRMVVLSDHDDMESRVIDTATGQAVLVLEGTGLGAAYSPDGRLIATADLDKTVRVRDAQTGKEARALYGHTSPVQAVGFSGDGKYVVSGSADRTVRVWRTDTGEEVRTLRGHSGVVRQVAFSPDGQRVVSHAKNEVKVWDWLAEQESRTFASSASCLAVRADGRALAALTPARKPGQPGDPSAPTLGLHDLTSEQELRSLNGWVSVQKSAAISPDGKNLALVRNGAIELWDVTTSRPIRVADRTRKLFEKAHANCVAFSAVGKRLVISTHGGDLHVCQARNAEIVVSLHGHLVQSEAENVVFQAALSADGQLAASASRDETVKLWNLQTEKITTLRGHGGGVLAVAFSPDGKLAASASEDMDVKLWDVTTGKNLRTLSGHLGAVQSVSFSPDGTRLASGSSDTTVKVWDLATGREAVTLHGHREAVEHVVFTPDGHRLIARDGMVVKVWDATPLSSSAKSDVGRALPKHLAAANQGVLRLEPKSRLKDALALLASDLLLSIDVESFERAGIARIEDQPVQLLADGATRDQRLRLLLASVNGSYRLWHDTVLVCSRQDAPAPPELPGLNERRKTLQTKLNEKLDRVSFDAGTPLWAALEVLGELQGFKIAVNLRTFQEESMEMRDILSQPVSCPRMVHVPLKTVLRLLTSQVGSASYLVQGDFIEVTRCPFHKSFTSSQFSWTADAS